MRRCDQFSKARVGQGIAIVFVTSIPQRDCLPASWLKSLVRQNESGINEVTTDQNNYTKCRFLLFKRETKANCFCLHTNSKLSSKEAWILPFFMLFIEILNWFLQGKTDNLICKFCFIQFQLTVIHCNTSFSFLLLLGTTFIVEVKTNVWEVYWGINYLESMSESGKYASWIY